MPVRAVFKAFFTSTFRRTFRAPVKQFWQKRLERRAH